MFEGINMFWARPRLILARLWARVKMSIYMPKNINSVTINITLEGIEKIKTEKFSFVVTYMYSVLIGVLELE